MKRVLRETPEVLCVMLDKIVPEDGTFFSYLSASKKIKLKGVIRSFVPTNA